MKKIVLFILCVISFQSGKSQHWLQPGATYNYNKQTQSTMYHEQMNYIKDTLVQGRICSYARNHIQTCYSYPCMPTIIVNDYFFNRQNDSVFMASNGGWKFLFNLSAQVGDIWNYGPQAAGSTPCTSDNRTIVDSIRFDTINGFSIKKIFIHAMAGSTYGYSGHITDRYGPAMSFFDYKGLSVFCPPTGVSPWYYSLSCYSDSLFQTGSSFCPSPFYFPANLPNIILANGCRVYPNPFTDKILIEFNENKQILTGKLTLFNSIGQIVKEQDFLNINSSVELKLDGLTEGLYIVEVETLYGKERIKVIKE